MVHDDIHNIANPFTITSFDMKVATVDFVKSLSFKDFFDIFNPNHLTRLKFLKIVVVKRLLRIVDESLKPKNT